MNIGVDPVVNFFGELKVTNAYLIFTATFCFIALKAFQQLNVVHNNRWFVLPTSVLMACFEVIVIYKVAHEGYAAILPMGLGGGFGCLAAMEIHQRLR